MHPLPSPAQAAALMDQTLLSPAATAGDMERLCAEAARLGCKAVCVNPCRLPLAVRLLAGSATLPITVAGFPLGAGQTEAKAREAGLAVEQGAAEVDMVLNIGALRDGDTALVLADMAAVVRACAPAPVKVILETCLLSDAEKELACRLALEAGAAFVKTSTGFGPGGATEADVALLRRCVGQAAGVKASGGVRSLDAFLRMVAAGASRVGTSSGAAILAELAAAQEVRA